MVTLMSLTLFNTDVFSILWSVAIDDVLLNLMLAVNVCFQRFFLSSRQVFMLYTGQRKSFLKQDNVCAWMDNQCENKRRFFLIQIMLYVI